MTSCFDISCCFIIFIIRTLYYLRFMYKIPLGLCRVVTGAVFGNCAKETITVLSCRIYNGCLFLKCMNLFTHVTLRSPQPPNCSSYLFNSQTNLSATAFSERTKSIFPYMDLSFSFLKELRSCLLGIYECVSIFRYLLKP